MPTRTEVIQALRARDVFRRDDMGQVMDYLEQEIGNSDSTARDNVVLGWQDVEEYTEKDLERIYDYVNLVGFPSVSFAVFKQGLRDRDFMSLRLVNYILDLIDSSVTPGGAPLVWADFTDISTLFQALALTTPVTADAQDVNSVQDKGSWGGVWDTSDAGANAPVYNTGVMNGESGLTFVAASSEGLRPTTLPPLTDTVKSLVIARVNGAPSGIGIVARMSNGEAGSYFTDAVPVTIESDQSKASQAGAHGSSLDWAAWISQTPTAHEVSLNFVAGTDSAAYTSAVTPAQSSIGVNSTADNNYLDNTSVLEVLAWVEGNVPSQADMEAYVTNKYGLAWA